MHLASFISTCEPADRASKLVGGLHGAACVPSATPIPMAPRRGSSYTHAAFYALSLVFISTLTAQCMRRRGNPAGGRPARHALAPPCLHGGADRNIFHCIVALALRLYSTCEPADRSRSKSAACTEPPERKTGAREHRQYHWRCRRVPAVRRCPTAACAVDRSRPSFAVLPIAGSLAIRTVAQLGVTRIVGAAGPCSARSSLGLRPWGSFEPAGPPTYVTASFYILCILYSHSFSVGGKTKLLDCPYGSFLLRVLCRCVCLLSGGIPKGYRPRGSAGM